MVGEGANREAEAVRSSDGSLGSRPTLSHQEGDHAGAGRGGRGGWRTSHERRHLVPGAQEAEGVGVPPADHVARPAGAAAQDQRDVAVEVPRGREAPAPAVDAERGAGVAVAAVLLAREMPSRYSSSRRGRHVATSVCHAVSFTMLPPLIVTKPRHPRGGRSAPGRSW